MDMGVYYILKDRIPSPVSWGKYLAYLEDGGRANKRVAETTLADGQWISTVFLGSDHQYGDGPPLLFETMAFPSRDELSQIDMERYSTWEEAESGHQTMVDKIKSASIRGRPHGSSSPAGLNGR